MRKLLCKLKNLYKLFIEPIVVKLRFKKGGKHSTEFEIIYVGKFTNGIAKAVCLANSPLMYRVITIDKQYNLVSETNISGVRSLPYNNFHMLFHMLFCFIPLDFVHGYARFEDHVTKNNFLLDRNLEIPSKFLPLLSKCPSFIQLESDYIVVNTSLTNIIMNYNLDIVAELDKNSRYDYLGNHFICVKAMQGYDIYNLETCAKVHRNYLKIGEFHNGIAAFQGLDNRWGFLDQELNVIMPSRFIHIYEYTKNGIWVEAVGGQMTHLKF